MEHLHLEEIVTLLLTAEAGPRSIELFRHPQGLKVKAHYDDGTTKSQNSDDAACFGVDATEWLGSLLPSEAPEEEKVIRPEDETVPFPTLPSVVPAAPLLLPHSDAGLGFLEEEASAPAAATQEQSDR